MLGPRHRSGSTRRTATISRAADLVELDTLTARLIYMNRIGAFSLGDRPPPVREMPEQQADYFAALESVLSDKPEGLGVRQTQLPVAQQLNDDFPGLGGVDLTVERDGQPVALMS